MTYYVGGAGLSNGGGVSPYTGTQAYVPGANSCVIAYVSYYNGSQTLLSVSLTDNGTPNNNANWVQRVLPLMVEHMMATAPAGADVKTWRY